MYSSINCPTCCGKRILSIVNGQILDGTKMSQFEESRKIGMFRQSDPVVFFSNGKNLLVKICLLVHFLVQAAGVNKLCNSDLPASACFSSPSRVNGP